MPGMFAESVQYICIGVHWRALYCICGRYANRVALGENSIFPTKNREIFPYYFCRK